MLFKRVVTAVTGSKMPILPESIELHDSEISTIEIVKGVLNLYLSPAYIHCDGKGWAQKAIIKIGAKDLPKIEENFPVCIADGHLFTNHRTYQNLLFLPLTEKGPVTLELELMSGSIVKITGNGVEVELVGERVFIENNQ